VRTHLENIYGRLQVSSRTAAVTRALGDLTAP
jgi:ATP/maltotriose-dependent transcriptional regulator MalT